LSVWKLEDSKAVGNAAAGCMGWRRAGCADDGPPVMGGRIALGLDMDRVAAGCGGVLALSSTATFCRP